MNLQKFFRRNTRILLMVFMSLLLVAFLVPEAVQGCRGQNEFSQVVGKAYGRNITSQDLHRVDSQLGVTDALQLHRPSDSMGRPLSPTDQFLLHAEAQHSGIRVSRSEAESLLAGGGMDANMLSLIAQRFKCSRDSVYDAVAEWLTVRKFMILQIEALSSSASAPRVERQFRDETQEASFNLTVLDAKSFIGRITEPTDAEIAAQFESGKDRDTAHVGDALSFGYKLPNRVAIEYITIDPVKMEPRIQVRESEAKEHYEANKSRYTERVPVPTTQTSQPAKFETRQLTYEEAKERVKRDKRTLKAMAEAQRAMNDVARKVSEPWVNAVVGKDGFRVPPAGATGMSLESLQKDFPKYPIEHRRTALLDERQLRTEPGIGAASYSTAGSQISFIEMAMGIKGLAASTTREKEGLNPLEPSPLFIVSELGPDRRTRIPKQGFIFRVTEVAPAGPPASMDGIRDNLIADIKLTKAYAMAEQYAKGLEKRAAEVGLAAAVNESGELRQILRESDAAASSQPTIGMEPESNKYLELLGPSVINRFNRRTPIIKGVGRNPTVASNLATQLFKLAEGGPASSRPSNRVVAVAAAPLQKWLVAELYEIKPLYADDLKERLENLKNQVMQREAMELQFGWHDPDNIQKRTGFVPAHQKAEGETD